MPARRALARVPDRPHRASAPPPGRPRRGLNLPTNPSPGAEGAAGRPFPPIGRHPEDADISRKHPELERVARARQRVAFGAVLLLAFARLRDRVVTEQIGQIADEQHDTEDRQDVAERIAGGDVGLHLFRGDPGRHVVQALIDGRRRDAHHRADRVAPGKDARGETRLEAE